MAHIVFGDERIDQAEISLLTTSSYHRRTILCFSCFHYAGPPLHFSFPIVQILDHHGLEKLEVLGVIGLDALFSGRRIAASSVAWSAIVGME